MVESRNSPTTDPLIIWLQGGPGYSSMTTFFVENGPYNTTIDSSLSGAAAYSFTSNPYSWNNKANVMYVDQPLGVGYSAGEWYTTRSFEWRVARDFYNFLTNFLD